MNRWQRSSVDLTTQKKFKSRDSATKERGPSHHKSRGSNVRHEDRRHRQFKLRKVHDWANGKTAHPRGVNQTRTDSATDETGRGYELDSGLIETVPTILGREADDALLPRHHLLS